LHRVSSPAEAFSPPALDTIQDALPAVIFFSAPALNFRSCKPSCQETFRPDFGVTPPRCLLISSSSLFWLSEIPTKASFFPTFSSKPFPWTFSRCFFLLQCGAGKLSPLCEPHLSWMCRFFAGNSSHASPLYRRAPSFPHAEDPSHINVCLDNVSNHYADIVASKAASMHLCLCPSVPNAFAHGNYTLICHIHTWLPQHRPLLRAETRSKPSENSPRCLVLPPRSFAAPTPAKACFFVRSTSLYLSAQTSVNEAFGTLAEPRPA